MRLAEIYRLFPLNAPNSGRARELLLQTNWFTVNVHAFDPKTGEALPQSLSAFLAKVAQTATTEQLRDRLWRIMEHARPSVERLFRALNESPRREHAMLPVHAVRELDASSFIKLSKRPGRNIREKLAGKPYLQAVRRFQSVNLPENRLLKAFVIRLLELLELRRDCLGEEEDELLPRIQSWLRSGEAKTIAHWNNLLPNNTLLSHRDYRRIWDAWRWLHALDDDIADDFSRFEARDETMRRWVELGRLYSLGTHRFAEMPLLFDYKDFLIRPWAGDLVMEKASQRISRSDATNVISEPVCIDLTELRPRYAITTGSSVSLHYTFLWQQWKSDDEPVDIKLFDSDAVYLHPDATSISSPDLFSTKDNSPEHLDRAARAFASKLRELFKTETLIWLVPDFVNDFEIEIARRNINARFPSAEPLPRSVAAVFEQVDYSKIKSDGFPIVVVDTIGGKTCVTKLIARFDPELQTRIPETKGFYWERCPPVVISQIDTESVREKEGPHCDIITVDAKGQWRDPVRPEMPQFIDQNTLNRDARIGKFAFCINLTNSPVIGGIRLHTLQQSAGDIPLWRDHIPELSIKGFVDGLYRRFYLVGKNTTVRPVRGKTVPLEISATFPLRAGKPFYSIPLYVGANADELGFSARLDSPEFPIKTDAVCKLSLTFEYGADEPYELIFTPLDKSFPPVRTTWPRTVEEIITDAPAPQYPTSMSWAELRRAPKPDSEETSDLLDWVLSAIDRLDSDLYIRPRKRTIGAINSYWHKDKNGGRYTFAKCEQTDISVFIHENGFVEGLEYVNFDEKDKVSFELEERAGKFTGRRVAKPNYQEETRLRDLSGNASRNLVKDIRKSLYVPFINVWRDGRSITDKECPNDFVNKAENIIAYLTGLLSQTEIPPPCKNEFLFLLACLHKDTTDDCVQWITEQVEVGNIRDPRAVGFALGVVSEPWQQYIFSSLASKPNPSVISVFAYAIWRDQRFVERFSISELQASLKALSLRLARINSVKLKGDGNIGNGINRDWVRATAETLELLLGLLRTRASKTPEIKMLLQPHQKITKELAQQVERVTEIVAQSNANLFSRVKLNLQKPAGDRTPDLLYALRLYLTGDDGANAIHITSVSDSDND